ncbi:adhesion G protein-coupled receptor F5-like [Rhinatrema bivittatum]|uniref:adhesion G protein-coupled receptor F5-like n=1 Tax=Rhinatrema bivittatum TaxID=194408 RepID=UPI001128279C|nr:adhesion G protein-coupled receptor F5-like [Rhinatrema bivittatum]
MVMERKLTWQTVFFYVLHFSLKSNQTAMHKDMGSLQHLLTDDGQNIELNTLQDLPRHKRDGNSAPVEYVEDIEISCSETGVLESLNEYLKNLDFSTLLNTAETGINIISMNVTTVCTVSDSESQCSCESGYTWPYDVCSKGPLCSNNCSCISTFPPHGPYCLPMAGCKRGDLYVPLGKNISVSCSLENNATTGIMFYNCSSNGTLKVDKKMCVSVAVNQLYLQLQDLINSPLQQKLLPDYLANLSSTATQEQNAITSSVGNIKMMINIVQNISNIAPIVNQDMMQNVLATVNIILDNITIWQDLEDSRVQDSSRLLQSMEGFTKGLQIVNNNVHIKSTNIELLGIMVSNMTATYNPLEFNLSNLHGDILINNDDFQIAQNSTIISTAYSTLKGIMLGNSTNLSLNGLVLSTVMTGKRNQNFIITMDFQKANLTMKEPECVFWNFNTNQWNATGCKSIDKIDTVTCKCDHLTAFSVLMSSSPSPDPVLDFITYIGVGISLGSLVLCIMIEALVWKSVIKSKTSYMRHVCLVNIAVSLLIADIWFIIGVAVKAENPTNQKACITATFFAHLFYLSLFFWMLTMGLVLFYRLVYVLHNINKTTMKAIAFSLGYGCPLLISIITIAVNSPRNVYIQDSACWLNIKETWAILAFVVPALTIVIVNFLILLVVLIKILRPSTVYRPRREEKSTLVHIGKSIAILTPLLGLTWGFGLGVVINPKSKVLSGIFSTLNSFQGLFILIFGTLWDTKIRASLLNNFIISKWISQQTKSTAVSSSNIPRPYARPGIHLFDNEARNISSSHTDSSSDIPSRRK